MVESGKSEIFARLVDRLDPGSRLVRAWPLTGGVSAQVTALEIEQPDGSRRKLVVRQHGAVDLADNPNVAADEDKLLRILQDAGIVAPAPCFVDASCTLFATPVIVVEYVEGQTDFAPAPLDDALHQLAEHLARIHAIDGARPDLAFLPELNDRAADLIRQPRHARQSDDDRRIRDLLSPLWPLSPRNPAVLLHGDFWPGNVLWRDGHVTAIIDWEDAGRGDPLADLATCRLELLWTFGIDAMQAFTRHYQAVAAIDFTYMPYWDLYAALRPGSRLGLWAADAAVEQTMRAGLRAFVAQAFESL